MQNYLVEGVSGTGKTSVCRELRRRGFHAVDGDIDLANQGDPATGEPTDVPSHWHHLWDVDGVRALVADQTQRITFFCGGSRNVSTFVDLFDAVFVLEVDRTTLDRRLERRPEGEFGARQSERDLIARLHRTGEDTPVNGVRIDATAPLAHVVDEILRRAPPTELLSASTAVEMPGDLVRRCGTVLAEYGPSTQDSGNVSFLVDVGPRQLFVKTAGVPGAAHPGSPAPHFDHDGRVRLLRNAVDLASSCAHPTLACLLNVIETPAGPALVYEAARGELIHVPGPERSDPTSAYQRFAQLPAEQLLAVFDALIDLHDALAAAGWVACDLYDGCLIVDFATAALTVIDLDTYRRGPSRNDMGRMFGSSHFMAPEELELGAVIDQRTTVFTLGRLVWHFGTRLSEAAERFCGPPAVADVVRQACRPSPGDRYADVGAFGRSWRAARTGSRSQS